MVSARILIHPRCIDGPGAGALLAHLQCQGYDIEKVVVGPPNAKGRCELVRLIQEPSPSDPWFHFERFDGSKWLHQSVSTPHNTLGPGAA